jgi:hypothetical protein
MKMVQVVIIIALQAFCCLGLSLLVVNRINWARELKSVTAEGMDLECCEPQTRIDDSIQTTSPIQVNTASGDSGLGITVIFLSLLFLCSFSFRKHLTPRFKIYMTSFIVLVMIAEGALVFHQQIVVPQAHRQYFEARKKKGDSKTSAPTLTTEHGAKIRVGPVHVDATVPDPNIIPFLMVCAFFVPWFLLEGKTSKKRAVPRRVAAE